MAAMAVRVDCRHYSTRTLGAEVVERCRLDVNIAVPFGCPEDCVFFEPRHVTSAGWQVEGRLPDDEDDR
jgi:hypothetical protein